MSKYINADLYNAKLYEEYDPSNSDDVNRGIGIAQDILNEMPSADVIEVVRCKDCKYYCTDNTGYCNRPTIALMFAQADDYCSYGERKETE